MKINKIIRYCLISCLSLSLLTGCTSRQPKSGITIDSIYTQTRQKDIHTIAQKEITTFDEVAWKNDTINTKLTLWNQNEALTNINIEVTDLVDEDKLIPKDNISIYWLKETSANLNRLSDKQVIQSYPDILHTNPVTSLDANELQSIWLQIYIPSFVETGNYTTTVSISCDQWETPQQIQLSINVKDFTLPLESDDFTLELWQHPFVSARYYGLEPFSTQHQEILLNLLNEYKSSGANAITATITQETWNHQSYDSDPSLITWIKNNDGTFRFDYTLFDTWISLAMQAGILNPSENIGTIKCYSIAPWNNQITYYDALSDSIISDSISLDSQQWKDVWTQFLTDFMQHLMDYGWFDITYIAIDERPIEEIEACIDLIESVQFNNQSFKIAAAFNYESNQTLTLLDSIDDLSIGLAHIDDNSNLLKELCTHRNQLGLHTTLYTCSTHYPSSYVYSDPAELIWSCYYAYKQDCNGFMRWSYDGWNLDPLNDATYKPFEPGDPYLIYPAEKDNLSQGYYPSVRYMMLKQGMNDIKKLNYLSSISQEIKDKIKQMMESLKRPDGIIDKYGNATYQSNNDKELVLTEVQRIKDFINQFE